MMLTATRRLARPASRIVASALLVALASLAVAPPEEARAEEGKERAVVVGAGYGGLETARVLAKKGIDVTLVDRSTRHTFVTRLHEHAASGTEIGADLREVARKEGFRFRQAEVTGLDAEKKVLRAGSQTIRYDSLVLAVGAESAYPKIPGLAEHSFGLRSPREARRVRTAVKQRLREAARIKNPRLRKSRARIVVGGAGATGVELAAELAEEAPALAREAGLSPRDVSVVLVQRSEVLSKAGFLKDGDRRLVRKKLRKLGVRVETGASLAEVTGDHVVLQRERGPPEKLGTRTLIWTGGVKAPGFLRGWGLPLTKKGQIAVDGALRVQGLRDVYAVGDAAAVASGKEGLAPMTAQEATAQGKAAAENILRTRRGKRPRRYVSKNKGMLISLGRRDGVGRIFGVRVSGRIASGLKRAVEWKHARKVRRSWLGSMLGKKRRVKAKTPGKEARQKQRARARRRLRRMKRSRVWSAGSRARGRATGKGRYRGRYRSRARGRTSSRSGARGR